MGQFLLSVTTGEPNHSSWWMMDDCDYTHTNRLFDDFDTARQALRERITQLFADHRDIEDLDGATIFDPSGQLGFPCSWTPERTTRRTILTGPPAKNASFPCRSRKKLIVSCALP